MLLQIIETLIVGVAGGSLFFHMHTPLPWMLGALTGVLLWSWLAKRRVCWPVQFANIGQVVIGYTIGRTFTPETCHQILIQLPVMLLVTVVTVVFSLMMGYLTHKRTGITLESSLIGSIPGGLTQVAVLCREVPRTDITVVTLMQTARLLAVVFVVPFLAVHGLSPGHALLPAAPAAPDIPGVFNLGQSFIIGGIVIFCAIAAWKLKMPTPFLLGAVVGAAGIALSGMSVPQVPQGYLDGAQLCIGAYTGARIKFANMENWRRISFYTMLGVAALLLCSLGIGFLLMYFHGLSLVTAFLCTAPGGMAEMGLTAMLLKADLSVIVAFQLFRLLFILMILPPILKWWLARQ